VSASPSILLAIAAGIAIAAACGLRAFLPLLAIGLAARFAHVPVAHGAEWLTGNLTLIALGVATVVEIAGDKIPVVDHALDAIGTLVRPVAAGVGAWALLGPLPAPWGTLLAVAFGGGALAVHAAKAKLRVGSSALTLGFGNPLLSFLEDGTVIGIVAAAILAPLIALIGVIVMFWLIARLFRRRAKAA
jgi:hypothetical protein